ncbi:MAG: HAD-IA family hydrolase [Rhodoluna sp.]|nr:HAD-IA family hydrolase [Rhodoluna sp.]MBP6187032.1 HAD-IA family hydrolase [Rhodoluna sp.]
MKFYASGLLFDNDGVLVDSHAAAIVAWAQWCSEYAPHINWNDPINAGQRAEDKVREWIASPDLFEEANNRINQLEQDTAHETIALPGAVELTSSMRDGLWTVCTSANPNLGRARLLAAGIKVPAELVTAADVKRGKPHPDPYLLGAERLGFAPEDCVVFEDAIAGAEAAVAAGVGLIVGVSKMALEGPADIVVRDLTGITFDGEVLNIADSNRLR